MATDPTNPFERPYAVISSQIDWARGNSETLLAAAQEALNTVASLTRFDFGAYTIPTPPSLSLPTDVPTIAIPQGGFALPAGVGAYSAPTFAGSFDLVPLTDLTLPTVTAYFSTFLETLKAKVGDMLGGSLGLPELVEAALSDRAKARVDGAGLKAMQEATAAWAARDFAMPSGMLTAAAAAATAKNQAEANGIARDVFVESSKWAIESVRWAAQQAVAIEDAQQQMYSAIQGLVQSAVKGTAEIAQGNREAGLKLLASAVQKFGIDMGNAVAQVQADVARYEAEAGAAGKSGELAVSAAQAQGQLGVSRFDSQVKSGEAAGRLAVAQYEVAIHEFDAQLQRVIEQVRLASTNMLGIAQQTSQLAAGFTASIHTGMNVSGSSSVSSGDSVSTHYNIDQTTV